MDKERIVCKGYGKLILIPFVLMLSYVVVIIEPRKSFMNLLQIGLYRYRNNWRNLSMDEIKSLSTLGRIVYLNETPPLVEQRAEKYKILMWKYGPTLEKFLMYHNEERISDPFEDCSVTNCILTYRNEDLSTADVVMVDMHKTLGVYDLPPSEYRNPKQIWVFETRESPQHTLMESKDAMVEYNGFFNWTMTYRMDADIPIPYGRTMLKDSPGDFVLETEFNKWIQNKSRDVLVAIMGSNDTPKNYRWGYVTQFVKYINVDIYGKCGNLTCPGNASTPDCSKLDKYMFYLAFENSNCDEYITEKLWWHSYHRNSIPIIMGPPINSLRKLVPENSYIHIKDFDSPKDMAKYLLYLNKTPAVLATYLAWKSKYTIVNEHGYFRSNNNFYCRVCEALNYNSKATKMYNDLEKYWSWDRCYPAWNYGKVKKFKKYKKFKRIKKVENVSLSLT